MPVLVLVLVGLVAWALAAAVIVALFGQLAWPQHEPGVVLPDGAADEPPELYV